MEISLKPGTYWSGLIEAGQQLEIANPDGGRGLAAFFWNAACPATRLNVADTMKVQGRTLVSEGDANLDDMGRVIAVITTDTVEAGHDFLVGGSTRTSVRAATSGRREFPNAQDHLRSAAAKFGLGRSDVGPSCCFFAGVEVDAGGGLHPRRGSACGKVSLLFLQDTLAAFSNTVHPLAEEAGAEPVGMTLSITSPALPNDTVLRRFPGLLDAAVPVGRAVLRTLKEGDAA